MVDEFEEYSTRDEKGNLISQEEAKVKCAKLLQKRHDAYATKAAKLGFAQLVVTGICVGLAISSDSAEIPMLINGASAAVLFTNAFMSGKKASAFTKIIKKIEDGEIDALEKLQSIEQGYLNKSESKTR